MFVSGVSREIQDNSVESIGFGYIAVPEDIDRNTFVDTCFRKKKVTIITTSGGVIDDCYITSMTLQNIQFPLESGGKGSCVVFVSNRFSTKPIIIGVISGDISSDFLRENLYQLRKSVAGTDIEIIADPNQKNLTINIASRDRGTININSKGSKDCTLNLNSSGHITLTSDETLNNISYNETTDSIIDVKKKNDIYVLKKNKDQFELIRRCEDSKENTHIVLDKEGLRLSTEDGNKKFYIDQNAITISTEAGQQEVKIEENNVAIKTNKTVTINNGKDVVTLANTLINIMSTYTNVITQAIAAGVNAGGVGAPNFTAAQSVITQLGSIDFSPIKSNVLNTD